MAARNEDGDDGEDISNFEKFLKRLRDEGLLRKYRYFGKFDSEFIDKNKKFTKSINTQIALNKCTNLAYSIVDLGNSYAKLALPLRLGFLSLLTIKKISIFDG